MPAVKDVGGVRESRLPGSMSSCSPRLAGEAPGSWTVLSGLGGGSCRAREARPGALVTGEKVTINGTVYVAPRPHRGPGALRRRPRTLRQGP